MAHDNPTPQGDVELARQALNQNDFQHAIHHIGCALGADPSNHEWLGVLNDIIARAPNILQLVELGDSASFSEAAVRAYVLAGRHQWQEALELICQVAETRPDCGYLIWPMWWLQQGAGQGLAKDTLIPAVLIPCVKLASGCPAPMDPEDPRFANVQCAAHILYALRQQFPDEPFCYFASSLVGRRLGTLDDALANAQHALQLDPSWRNCIGVANVLRDMKRYDEALSMFRQALAHDASDVSALLDAGDMMIQAERLQEAQGIYNEVLAKKANHPWATASLHYVSFKLTGDESAKDALLALRSQGNDRARELGDEIDPPVPYVTWLPRGADATCNAMRHTFEQMFNNPAEYHGSTYELALTHLESPTLFAAFRLQMEMWGPMVKVNLDVENIQQPDPRVPKAQVDFQLWNYDGVQPTPNMNPPDRRVSHAVFELAEQDFHLDSWVPQAKNIARQLQQDDLWHLLGCMVHPPRPPGSDWRVLVWVQRVQVAAALIIAFIDQGWENSRRKRALYSLLYGPTDWSVDAAIIALGVIARQEPNTRAEILQAFAWLQTQIPAMGFTCFEYPLCATWMACGPHDDITTQKLKKWEENILNGKTGSSSVKSSRIEPAKFDQAEEMAKAQAAQQQIAGGGGGDPDPVVFPGQPVAKLSDYVRLMKAMQGGDMMGALGQFGLDMGSYGPVAMQWGQALQADPTLNAKFGQMMGM